MAKKKVDVPAPDVTTISDWIYGGLLLVVVAIMPLVVRVTLLPVPPELAEMYHGLRPVDFFSYYKGWLLGIPATFIVICFLVELFLEKYKGINIMSRIYKPEVVAALVFLWMALFSAIFSSYRHTSWRGAVDRGEGMWILLAYFIVFFAAMLYVRKERNAKLIIYGLAFSSIIMGLIGLSQFLERDFFMTGFGQWFLSLGVPAHARTDRAFLVEFDFAYGTLYNPNTFGKYTAFIAPILLSAGLFYNEKGRKGAIARTALFLGGGLMLIGVFGSRSLGGFIGIGAAVTVTILAIIIRFVYQMKTRTKEEGTTSTLPKGAWLAGAGVFVVLVASLFLVPVVNDRFNLALARFDEALRGEVQPMNELNFAVDQVTLVTEGQERFSLVMSEDDWHVYDSAGQIVPVASRVESAMAGGPVQYFYQIPGYRTIYLEYFPDALAYNVIGMRYVNGRIYVIAPNNGLIDMSIPVPAIGFYGREHWGSNRGHIWSRTFPLMRSRVIVGSGPDTFTQVFPQHDIVAKHFLHGNAYIRIDKAHNVFLQAWVTTGGISAVALLFLFIYYLITTLILLVRTKLEEGRFIFGLQFGLLAGVSAFMIGAMSTDSTIGSSGVLYLILGLGYGINYMVRKANAK